MPEVRAMRACDYSLGTTFAILDVSSANFTSPDYGRVAVICPESETVQVASAIALFATARDWYAPLYNPLTNAESDSRRTR